MATIDINGITIKTLSEWKAELEAIYHAVDPEWDLSPNTPDGQIVAAFAEMLANQDESQLDSYNAADPDKATKEALDAIMRLSGVERREGTLSTAVVQLSGVETTVVPTGTLIENAVTGTRWATDAEVVIGASATDAAVTCTTIGAQTAGIGELTKIATPVTGLESVTNAAAATQGQNEMTDPEARLYREETISNPATNTVDAIHAAVATVTGVTTVRIYNNRTDSADGNGIPGHSFSVIVAGGDDEEVAQAIYSKLPPGPGMYGGTNPETVEVTSENNNNTENITFGRPTDVPLYAQVNLTQTGTISDAAKEELKQAMVDFSLGNLFDNDVISGYRKTPFRIGEDISSGILHTPVNYYMGKNGQGYVTSIYLDTSASPSAPSTVAIDWDALASLSVANIEVVVS